MTQCVPTISAIVPCRNKSGSIARVIYSLLKQLDPLRDEIIVVDNGSDDGSLDTIRQSLKGVGRLVDSSKPGRSIARNAGASVADGDVLLFVDADMIPCPGLVDAHRQAYMAEHACGFSGLVFAGELDEARFRLCIGTTPTRLISEDGHVASRINDMGHWDWRARFLERYDSFFMPWVGYYSANASVDRRSFYEVGGFDEAINTWASEDVDLGFRLHSHGRVAVLSTARVIHWPHPRDRQSEVISNRRNEYYLLHKYQDPDMECFVAYGASSLHARPAIESVLSRIREDTGTPAVEDPGELFLSAPSDLAVNGTILGYDKSGCRYHMPLTGFAVPSPDSAFRRATIAAAYALMPEPALACLLHEVTRIADEVMLKLPDRSMNWSDSIITVLRELPYWHVQFRSPRNLNDFQLRMLEDEAAFEVRRTGDVQNGSPWFTLDNSGTDAWALAHSITPAL